MDTENVVVTKQDRKYKTLVTDIGKEKMTNAILNGKKVNVVMAAVGDGGGSYYLPTADMTALVHEVWRGAIASKEINSKSSNMVDVKFVLPGTVGGYTPGGGGRGCGAAGGTPEDYGGGPGRRRAPARRSRRSESGGCRCRRQPGCGRSRRAAWR